MSSNFADGLNMTMRGLQQENRRLINELAATDQAHASVVPRATFDQEKADHDATKVKLDAITRTLRLAEEKIARGRAKHGDWDAEVVARQSWIDWYGSVQHDVNQIKKAYSLSCVENNINTGHKKSPHALKYVDVDSVRRGDGLAVDPEENFELNQYFPFRRLVNEFPEIARKIALYTMKKGSIVHFIARLDLTEDYPPRSGGLCTVAKVPMRFWWGPGKKVNINTAPTMDETLAPLYVCRDFTEIFGTAFYAKNKFSFASFGELNIFKRHTLHSWIQRIRQVEIWWQGSKGTLPLDWGVNPAEDHRYDRRTWPLMALTWMSRLESIEIYVDESSKTAKRRADEPQYVQDPLLDATRGQENNRQLRDLRKLHGLDYVYQLRKIRRVLVYDMMVETKRTGVRDKSFVRDMRAQVTKPRSKRRAEASRLENLKPMLRRNDDSEPYERSPQVNWICRSLQGIGGRWNPNLLPAAGQNGPGGGECGGGGGGGDDAPRGDAPRDDSPRDDAPRDLNGVGEENPGSPGNGGDGPQNRDNDSDSDSSDDSDADPDSLFVRQPGLSRIQAQPGRFTGRRNMARDANGALNHGFGEGAIEIDSDDDDDDDDDDDVIVDEGRSAPACPRGMHIDLTNIPDDESGQVKEEDKDKDMDVDDVPAPSPAPDANPATDVNGVKPDDGTAPAPHSENAAGDDAQSQEPKSDEDTNMPDIYGASPGLENGAAVPPEPNMIQQTPQGNEEQEQEVPVPDAEMADPADVLATSPVIAESPILNPAETPIPSVERPEQPTIIDLDDYSYDDEVEFIEERFEPIKIEDDDDDYLPEMQEAIARSCRRSNHESAAPTHGRDADVKVEESAPDSVRATQATPNVMREAASLRRSLTPAAGRYVTPDPHATPSSPRAAAENEALEGLNFDTPTPDTPRASAARRDSSSSSKDNASVDSSAASRKRSRGEDASTPRPVDIDQMVSPSRRSSRSSGISASVTRGIDELDLLGGQGNATGRSPPSKRRRGSPGEQAESGADIAKAQEAWLKSIPKK